MKRVLVAGNGVAGLTVADTLRTLGFTGELTIIGAESHDTYSRPALSKTALQLTDELNVDYLPVSDHSVTQLKGRRTISLDPLGKKIYLDNGEELSYDGLAIATGTSARRFTDSAKEFTLRSLDDAVKLKMRLVEKPSVTVIGGGALGMEIASGAIDLGCEVTLVHKGTPMSEHIGPYLARIFTEVAEEKGLSIIDDIVTDVCETPTGVSVTCDSGRTVSSDVVVSAAGDIPNVDWLASSGLLTEGRLITDSRCRVTESIVACGDVAWIGGVRGPTRTPIWTAAIEEAKTAAEALLRGDQAPELEYQSYFWTDQWGLNLKISGPIPEDSEPPIIVSGSVDERKALFHWPHQKAAASLGMRMPIPKLHRLAQSAG